MPTRSPHHRHAACLLLALGFLLYSCRERPVLPFEPDVVLAQADSTVLFLQSHNGDIAAWDAQTGTTWWATENGLNGYPRRLMRQGDALLAIHGHDYQVLDANTGTQRAHGILICNDLGSVDWQGERMYIEDFPRNLQAVDTRHDAIVWQRAIRYMAGRGYWMAWDSTVFYLRGDARYIYALQPATGAMLDSIPLVLDASLPYLLPEQCKIIGETALLVWSEGLAAFHMPTRRVLWRHDLPDVTHATALQGHDAIWLALQNTGELRCITLRDGQTRKSYPHEPANLDTQLLVHGDWIWLVQGRTLVALQTVPPYAFHEAELPLGVLHGPFQVGQQLGLVLGDNTLFTCDLTPPL